MGANGTGRALNQRGGQQHQQHGDNVTRGIEAQVDHVEMTTRNKDLVHLVTDRADGAKEQSVRTGIARMGSTFCSVSIQILASVTTSRTIEIHPTMCFTRAKG